VARFKKDSKDQSKFVAVSFDKQIIPGTFEAALDDLIDNVVDLSVFDCRFRNEETGAPAYNPAILLKIVLYAYSRGVIHSRKIAKLCEDNVVFMALTGDSRPHFTTIANFVSSCEDEIISVFRDILFVCNQEGLIGKDMFAIDGVKLPSNASKEWSGTRKDFKKKLSRLEAAIRDIVAKHRQMDLNQTEAKVYQKEQKRLRTLRKKYKKIKKWLSENDDKRSLAGKVVKSNITDNESAKMTTSHGVIQGYDGVAAVDSRHQVIVQAEAFGEAQENHLLEPMIEGVRENFDAIGDEKDVFEETKLTADAGFHNEANMNKLFSEKIDGYVADNQFRTRDERYKTAQRHKPAKKKPYLFSPDDFIFDKKSMTCICPAGKRMYIKNRKVRIGDYEAIAFIGWKTNCRVCQLRSKCLKNPQQRSPRQVYFFQGRSKAAGESYSQKMKNKIDTAEGKHLYSYRLATAEPVFANICSTKGMNRFTLRGKSKVNAQWLMYCIVHNIEKIFRYAPSFA
jgi:transposase